MKDYYILNLETGKLELHFERETYKALPDELKANIKSNFLWSRTAGAWVSRAKEPRLHWALAVAERLGLTDAGKTGERLSFAEQIAAKQERAQERAERYERHAENAAKRGAKLQAPINAMHGDIAFFTQPNINTSAGRAFTRRREKMFEAFEKGFSEFRKSDYWKDRAATAKTTAAGKELTDKGFVQRRIDECEKNLRALKKHYQAQENTIKKIEAGETVKNWSGQEIDIEKARENLAYWEDRIEMELDKLGFYQDTLEGLGGITFNKKSFQRGDLLFITRWKEPVRFVRGGPKNFTYEFTVPHMKYADGSPMTSTAAYAEITKKV